MSLVLQVWITLLPGDHGGKSDGWLDIPSCIMLIERGMRTTTMGCGDLAESIAEVTNGKPRAAANPERRHHVFVEGRVSCLCLFILLLVSPLGSIPIFSVLVFFLSLVVVVVTRKRISTSTSVAWSRGRGDGDRYRHPP